jgi:alginate O-acetyltransferase complex protein AlgI
MIFNIKFFLLLIVSSIIYWIIPKQNIRNLLLTLASLGFIYYLDRYAILVVILLTIYTYIFGFLIESNINKKLFHKIGIIGLIIVLVIFKYLGLLTNTLNGFFEFFGQLPVFNIEKILLPLGLSYITFKYLSYLTDIYWGLISKGNFINFLLYGSFFTIFIAGPIERFEKFQPQVNILNIYNFIFIEKGFERIVYGIFKKFVLADWLSYFISPILQDSNSNIELKIIAIFGFSLQIYFDFSAYSDIAIGSSLFFGIKITENFNYPYLQPNISQFWRNWHISLSNWIRDYLFFPLSRFSNKKVWAFFAVPMIAMGICGIWHGASWNFLIWGFWHGAGISIYQIYKITNKKNKTHKNLFFGYKIINIIITFLFVSFGWFFFI